MLDYFISFEFLLKQLMEETYLATFSLTLDKLSNKIKLIEKQYHVRKDNFSELVKTSIKRTISKINILITKLNKRIPLADNEKVDRKVLVDLYQSQVDELKKEFSTLLISLS